MRKWNARSIGISTSMPEHERAKLELLDIDGEIAHLEALLELRNEQRRELVNYLGLNKERASER